MSYQEFVEYMIQVIELKEGRNVTVVRQTVNRINCQKEGITIRRGKNDVSPVIEVNDIYTGYKAGAALEKCLDEILRRDYEGRKNSITSGRIVTHLRSWDYVRKSIFPRLMKTDKNMKQLQELVHRPYVDLSIYYVVKLGENDGRDMSVKVTGAIAGEWGVSEAELYNTALENLEKEQYSITNVEEMIMQRLLEKVGGNEGEMAQMMEEFELDLTENNNFPMYVLTNESKLFGFAGILNKKLLKDFAEKHKADIFIIPSSVHEALLVPAIDNLDTKHLQDTVKEVNETELEEEDVLSDNVYYYSRFGECITMVDC